MLWLISFDSVSIMMFDLEKYDRDWQHRIGRTRVDARGWIVDINPILDEQCQIPGTMKPCRGKALCPPGFSFNHPYASQVATACDPIHRSSVRPSFVCCWGVIFGQRSHKRPPTHVTQMVITVRQKIYDRTAPLNGRPENVQVEQRANDTHAKSV